MKKSYLIGLVAALGVTSVADAVTMKEVCEQNPDKFVWVSSTSNCVAKHPCADPLHSNYTFYCNTEFKYIQVSSAVEAQELVNMYVTKKLGMSAGCDFLTVAESAFVGQDYVQCKTSNGGYIEFEFDDYSESRSGTSAYNYKVGKCIAYGGHLDGDPGVMEYTTQDLIYDRRDYLEQTRFQLFACAGVSEDQCFEMYADEVESYDPKYKTCYLRGIYNY